MADLYIFLKFVQQKLKQNCISVCYIGMDSLKSIDFDNRFDNELAQLIDGRLSIRHVFNIGKPSEILTICGFPPRDNIELAAGQLERKSKQHNFDKHDLFGLVNAINNPVAVFYYGDAEKAQNVIIELKNGNKNFIVGVHFYQKHGNTVVSSIRGLFPKDAAEWLNWITQGKALYLNIKKIQAIIDKQQTNLADVTYLDLDSIIMILREHKSVNKFFLHLVREGSV